MGEVTISLPYLESFTTAELYELAEKFDIELPPGLARSLVIGEFFDSVPCLDLYKTDIKASGFTTLSTDLNEGRERGKTLLAAEGEPVKPHNLPRHFGFNYIDVLVRDPYWVFVMWEVSSAERKKHEKQKYFSSYLLRVRLDAPSENDENDGIIFSYKIASRDNSRYLSFPPDDNTLRDKNSYIVEVCAGYKNAEVPIIASKPFKIPKTLPMRDEAGFKFLNSPIFKLSGIKELQNLCSIVPR